MKKVLLSFVLATIGTLSVNAQQRLVLYEEFTGENCGPCAANNPGLEALMAAGTNPSKIAHITFMEPIPSAGKFYYSQESMNDYRMGTYYNPVWAKIGYEFTPSGIMDGTLPDTGAGGGGNIASFTQSDIDAEYAKPSSFNITVSANYNGNRDSIYLFVTVNAISADSGTFRLRAAYTKTMDFSRPIGSNGETHFENVVRTMLPTVTGTLLPTKWKIGDTRSYTIIGKVAGLDTFTNVKSSNIGAVVWIQNDADKYVHQVARANFPTAVPTVVATASGLTLYPNPARETTTVSFSLDNASFVQVQLLDQAGRVVKDIAAQNMNAGTQKFNINTASLASGTYNVKVVAGTTIATQRLSVIR